MTGRSFPKFITALVFFLVVCIITPAVINSRLARDLSHDTLDTIASTPDEITDIKESPEPVVKPPQASPPDAGPSGSPQPDEPEEPEIPEDIIIIPWLPSFDPYAVPDTEPGRMIASTAVMADGKITDSFSFEDPIDFGFGDTYSELEGVITFRGNNFRDSAAYGYADIRNARFGEKWSRNTGSLRAPDGAYWSGHGWTGQPLIANWPKETRMIMNLHSWAKEQDELVEVVYPAMDGYVYFTELETGKPTRDRLFLGFTFKGAGALDPRGYPLLYVGAGYGSSKGPARIFIVSLVDGSVLHTFGNGDSFAQRSWPAADSSPLVDAQTDTLIYPSENGVIYFLKLNSVFDPTEGTISIAPSAPVKWRFKGKRSQTGGKYWLGMESSASIWRGYLFITDNGGHLICLDINRMELVWVQDVLDDTNNSPVIELENGHPYLYISTGFHGGWRAPVNSTAPVPIWKIDAVTGEIVWRTDYNCRTADGVSGGVQGTIALGKNSLDGLIFVPVARTPTGGSGILSALDKVTGEIIWELRTQHYGWSSPVCVYDRDGKGYIVFCTSGGYMYLVDGLTGELMDSLKLGGVIEASPAVYESTVVIGTRAMKIWGVKLT